MRDFSKTKSCARSIRYLIALPFPVAAALWKGVVSKFVLCLVSSSWCLHLFLMVVPFHVVDSLESLNGLSNAR